MINQPTPEPLGRYIETEEFKLFKDPRISASKLGEYLVADESRKKTILKNAKKAPKAITLHYTKARNAFPDSFRSNGFSAASLARTAARLQQRDLPAGWEADENRLSADVLEKLSLIVEQIEFDGASKIARPKDGWGSLSIAGVNISVNLDCVFSMPYRGRTRTGAVILYTTKDSKMSLDKHLGDITAGDYVAAILLRLLEEKLSQIGPPLPQKCFVVDVHRGTIHQPCNRAKTLFKHINAACEGIASRWKDIKL